ncbi:MAG: PF20097 family protein [Akkermansiaceae bacterium]
MSEPNPFATNDPHKIYAPPLESPEGIKPCPSCNQEMEPGFIRSNSNVTWLGDTQSRLKKAISGGNLIGKTKSGLGCKYPAHHCKSCNLFTLAE